MSNIHTYIHLLLRRVWQQNTIYACIYRHIRRKKLLTVDSNYHVDFCCSSAEGIVCEELLMKARRLQLMTKRYCFGTRWQRYRRRSEAVVEGLDARCIPVDKLRRQVLVGAFDKDYDRASCHLKHWRPQNLLQEFLYSNSFPRSSNHRKLFSLIRCTHERTGMCSEIRKQESPHNTLNLFTINLVVINTKINKQPFLHYYSFLLMVYTKISYS